MDSTFVAGIAPDYLRASHAVLAFTCDTRLAPLDRRVAPRNTPTTRPLPVSTPFTTVLFDLDGTLVDSIELIVRSAEHAFASRPGRRPSRSQIQAGIGRPLLAQFGEFTESPEDLAACIAAYREYQMAHHDALTTIYDGVIGVVERLHAAGCTLGVVTSKIEPLAHRALRHVGLDHLFSLVVGLESTTRHKPEPDPILFALGRLRASPASTAYVGDTPFDVLAARAAGVSGIAVTWGACDAQTLASHKPDSLVHSPEELALRLGVNVAKSEVDAASV
jgi:pyrophosphatase PpaX